jgi:hypothetical protein
VRFDAGPGGQQEERVPAAEQVSFREPIREMIDPSSDDDGGESSRENGRSSLFVEQHPTVELSLDARAGGRHVTLVTLRHCPEFTDSPAS